MLSLPWTGISSKGTTATSRYDRDQFEIEARSKKNDSVTGLKRRRV
jgi:hypothetical protein